MLDEQRATKYCWCWKLSEYLFRIYLNQRSGYNLILWANVRTEGKLCNPQGRGERSRPAAWPRLYKVDRRAEFAIVFWVGLASRSCCSVGFGWVTIFQWYFVYLSVMMSRTNEIFRSSCRVRFVTYHGASIVILSMDDWAFWRIAWLALLAHTHISIPYVHIGYMTDLYSKSLFSNDRGDFLPVNKEYWKSKAASNYSCIFLEKNPRLGRATDSCNRSWAIQTYRYSCCLYIQVKLLAPELFF